MYEFVVWDQEIGSPSVDVADNGVAMLVRHSFASGHASQWTCADAGGLRWTDAPVTGTAALPRSGAPVPGAPLCRAEGEGFEPPRDGTAPSDFRDHA